MDLGWCPGLKESRVKLTKILRNQVGEVKEAKVFRDWNLLISRYVGMKSR